MMARCYRPGADNFKRYKERGIIVCTRWHNFYTFVDDMGVRPFPKASIDRIDNDGNYEPSNCRWATQTQQMRNTSYNIVTTINGKEACLTEHAHDAGIPQSTVYFRYKAGKRGTDLILTPNQCAVYHTYDGRTQSIADWSRETGIKQDALERRLRVGKMTIKEALEKPYNPRKNRRKATAGSLTIEEDTTNVLEDK